MWYGKGSGSVGGSNSSSSSSTNSRSQTDSSSTTRQGTELGTQTLQQLLGSMNINLTNALGDQTYSKTAAIEDSRLAMDAAIQSALQSGIGGVNQGNLGTGAYNSTTRQLLADNLTARAAAEGAGVAQQTIAQYADIDSNNQQNAINSLLATLGLDQSGLSKTDSTSTTTASSNTTSKSKSTNWNAATEGGWK